jgi:hypothetical protein
MTGVHLQLLHHGNSILGSVNHCTKLLCIASGALLQMIVMTVYLLLALLLDSAAAVHSAAACCGCGHCGGGQHL